MKKTYEQPTIELVEIDHEDIMTVSGVGIMGGHLGGDLEHPFSDL